MVFLTNLKVYVKMLKKEESSRTQAHRFVPVSD